MKYPLPRDTDAPTEKLPDLSIDELMSLLRIYKETAEKSLCRQADDPAAELMFKISRNAILYLSAYKNGLEALQKFNDRMNYIRLRSAELDVPQQ